MRLSELEKAYALAVKASENPDIPNNIRAIFRAIHFQIWKSCGDDREQQGQLVVSATETGESR